MEAPDQAIEYFPEACQQLAAYAAILNGPGIERGLMGPREAPRVWDRHILNSAAVVEESCQLVPTGASVIDVGSGAGLPGLVWAIVRPDVTVTLIESLERRSMFLHEAVVSLGLAERVSVVRSRAEDVAGKLSADVVTARAVAPLVRLIPWTAPLVAPRGSILAIKGSNAAEEIVDAASALRKIGAGSVEVVECGAWLDQPTVVVRIADLKQGGVGKSANRRGR